MKFLNRKVSQTFSLVSRACSGLSTRPASTYEGDGKTSAQVLNKDLDNLMINSYSSMGFRLNNGIRIFGPLILFPRTFLSWNISGIEEVNERSLSLFSILCPKVDIIVLGYGDPRSLPRNIEVEVFNFGKQQNIGIEMLPTENAVATFNYLNHEKRYVVGALIPPKQVKTYDDRDLASQHYREKILNED